MPSLTVSHPRGQGERGGLGDYKWTEEVMEEWEGEAAGRRWRLESLIQTPADPQKTSWSQTLRKLPHWELNFRGWCCFALVAAVWAVYQVEAPLQPSVLLVGVCWRLLLVCFVWTLLAGCVHAIKNFLWPRRSQGKSAGMIEDEVKFENRSHSWTPRPRSPGPSVPLALALVDSLLLCVLQEPLPDPSIPHIKTLICRLESVFRKLDKADIPAEPKQEEMNHNSEVIDKGKLIKTYLQKRMSSLCWLVQVQGDFETSVKDMLEGLDGLWAQLEELHTGVTLTKEGSQGHRDLASALTDAETLFAVLGRYKKKHQHCQNHLKKSTQLLQELTWSHTHISNSVKSCSESVWPELLLQSNIEQFDKVQENFLSMEQQTSTFKAHLEGLGKLNQNGHTQTNGVQSGSLSRKTSSHHNNERANVAPQNHSSTSKTTPASSSDKNTDVNSLMSLCERSALQFSSTISRLRKSGRRK